MTLNRFWSLSGLAAAALAAVFVFSPMAFAQNFEPGALNGGRDCRVIRTCNFERTGAVRGCLSSYTCRTCKLITSRCQIGNAPSNTCQRFSCSWGG
jgi:hypothetical protein